MYTTLTLIASIIQNITYLGVMLYLTHVSPFKILTSKKDIGLIALSTIIMYLVQKYDNAHLEIGAMIAFTQYVTVVMMISGMPPKNVMTSVLFSFFMQFMFQMPAIIIALLFSPDFSFITSVYGILTTIISASFFSILSILFLPVRKLYEKTLHIPSFILFTISFLFAFYGIACAIFREISMPDYLILFFVVIFLVLVFFLVMFYAVQTQKKEQAIHYYETYLPILNDMILNIRKTQHNHNNTVMAIANLPQSAADYDSLAAALEQYGSHMVKETIPTRLLHFENKLLTALLYNKYCLFTECQISLDISIQNYGYNSKANAFQLVDLTGILLDNAIEACQPGDTVYVEIGASPQNSQNSENSGMQAPFSITVKNPGPVATPDFIKQIFSAGYTTKTGDDSQHGLGLPYVKSLVHQCKGQIEIENDMISPPNEEEPCRYFIIHVTV